MLTDVFILLHDSRFISFRFVSIQEMTLPYSDIDFITLLRLEDIKKWSANFSFFLSSAGDLRCRHGNRPTGGLCRRRRLVTS